MGGLLKLIKVWRRVGWNKGERFKRYGYKRLDRIFIRFFYGEEDCEKEERIKIDFL